MCRSHACHFSQRKFREVDEEESYFDCDDDEDGVIGPEPSQNTNEATDNENDLHRTPRMFSLSDTDETKESGDNEDGDGRNANAESEKGTSNGVTAK